MSVPPPDSKQPHPTWINGDFELISSDNTSFKVSSRVLSSVSDFFADTLETGSGQKKATLDDNASVIDRFLELAVHGTLITTTSNSKELCVELAPLIQFMSKYDCERLLPQLQLCLIQYLDEPECEPMQVFALVSAANSTLVCIKALERICTTDPDGGVATPAKPVEDPLAQLLRGCPMDPGRMSYRMSTIVQHKHAWALHRAWTLTLTTVPYAHSRTATRALSRVVDEFKDALETLESALHV